MLDVESCKVAIISLQDCPKSLWKRIHELSEGDGYRCFVELKGDMELTESTGNDIEQELLNYWLDQQESNDFVGDLDDFTREYGLELELWVARNVPLYWEYDKILFEMI